MAEAIITHTKAATSAGRSPQRRLVAGILPDATSGLTDPQMVTALCQRYQLIENRADAVLDRDITDRAPWLQALPAAEGSAETWRGIARLVAAYRDRWEITDPAPFGRAPDRTGAFAQQADHRRITAAVKTLSGQPGGAADQVPNRVRAGRDL